MKNEPSRKILFRPELLLAGVVTLAIVCLHFYFWLNVGGVWRDEVNSINVASHHSLSEMTRDSFPVLMPLLLHNWLALGFGKTDLSLRVFGLLVGLGIPAALWLASWKIKRAPPLIGLVLFGTNSTLIVFGDSIRAYGLGSLLVALTTAAACLHLQRPTWKRTALLALLCVLSVQTLYHNAVLVGAICIGGWAVCLRRKTMKPALQIFLAGAAAAISLLPYYSIVTAGRSDSIVLRTGLDHWRFRENFTNDMGFPLEQYIFIWALLALLMAFGAIRSFVRKNKSSESTGETMADDLSIFSGTTIMAALAGFCIFLFFAALPSQSWYLLPFMALTVVCFDVAWPVLQKKLHAIFFGFIAATALISIPTAAQLVNYHMTNVDILNRKLSAAVSPQDYVIVVPWFCGISFDHYFKAPTPWETLPPLADHSSHRYDLVKIQLQNTNAIAPVFAQIKATLQSGHRVWVVAGLGLMDVPDPGTVAPKSLPPAPALPTRWQDDPYTYVWDSQVGHYLGDHSMNFGRVGNLKPQIRVAENMELFLAEGWRESGPIVPAAKP